MAFQGFLRAKEFSAFLAFKFARIIVFAAVMLRVMIFQLFLGQEFCAALVTLEFQFRSLSSPEIAVL